MATCDRLQADHFPVAAACVRGRRDHASRVVVSQLYQPWDRCLCHDIEISMSKQWSITQDGCVSGCRIEIAVNTGRDENGDHGLARDEFSGGYADGHAW